MARFAFSSSWTCGGTGGTLCDDAAETKKTPRKTHAALHTHALADVVLRGHQVLHLGPQQFVVAVHFVLDVHHGVQLAGQRQGPGILFAGLGFSLVSLLCVTGRNVLLLGQHLSRVGMTSVNALDFKPMKD